MYGFRKKYQKNNRNNDKKEVEETTTRTIVETKIEKPNTKKVILPSNRYERNLNSSGRASAIFSLKRDNDLIIKTNVRQSSKDKDKKPNKEKENVSNHSVKTTIYSSKPNNRWSVVQEREDDAPSTRWRRYNRNKKIQEEKPIEEKPIEEKPIEEKQKEEKPLEEKPQEEKPQEEIQQEEKPQEEKPQEEKPQEEKPIEENLDNNIKIDKIVKEEIIEATPNTINTTITKTTIIENKKDDKNEPEIKTEITIVTTKNEVSEKPEDNKDKVDDKKSNENENEKQLNEGRINYNYDRSKLGLNKTDEDIPLNKKKEKEEVKVESKKRMTLNTSFIPGSKILLEDNLDKKKDDKKSDDKKNKYKNENRFENRFRSDNKKNRFLKEDKIVEHPNEAGRKEKINRLKIALNEIEKANTRKILKKDLVELFEKILDYNLEFKDKIFFKNLNDTERKVGNMDNKEIPHTYKEIETSEIIRRIPNAEDLMKKYTQRAHRIIVED